MAVGVGIGGQNVSRDLRGEIPDTLGCARLGNHELDLGQVTGMVLVPWGDEQGNQFSLVNRDCLRWQGGRSPGAEITLREGTDRTSRAVLDEPLLAIATLRMGVRETGFDADFTADRTLPANGGKQRW